MNGLEAFLKLVSGVVLGVAALAGVLLPVRKIGAQDYWLLGPLNTFAAGVFLSLAVIHLMPEAEEGLPKGYNISSLVMMTGYLALLGMDTSLKSGYTELQEEESQEMRSESEDIRTETRPGKLGLGHVLMAVLSFHSVIEGLTIGIEVETKAVLLMTLGIGIHKGIAGIALGSSFLSASVPTAEATQLGAVFALSTPLGILLGFLARSVLPAAASSLIKALSAGTFMYVGASELVPSEFNKKPCDARRKLASLSLGVAAIYLLTILLDF
eukprot:TRINITY_DN30367_c0_g1_i1.p1 TRINITY_DN30367_c0_g1~~TRINITY_DN30367_c0_g1_i1.p1  ORF type:complete len:269 (+),score=26.56 TRINITY_DN30367_c0_g1_i1:34-840(+)